MRAIPFLTTAAITVGLVYTLHTQLGKIPPMGKFLSPQQGFWQNAEPADQNFSDEIQFAALKGNAEVYFDDRLVPHVFAENDEDLYFIQGYLHAKFRLFQMDLQTKAAEGRASEIAGKVAIDFDKTKRRLGMKFAAENALIEAEKDTATKMAFDNYTKGVNAYIETLTQSSLPFEYKLLNCKPEAWSNLRSALLLKMMAEMLASGTERDLLNTNAKAIFTPEEMELIYPQIPDSLMPIIPKETIFEKPAIVPIAPQGADSNYIYKNEPVQTKEVPLPNKNNGSNNWVVAGSKTQSGAPILCNDPHLELSLPAIWYEIQLKTPTSNSYGVSIPGTPFIIIGFNDSISWGVTNAQRDVKDYYEIKFKDNSKQEYWFDSAWHKTKIRIEEIKVKGASTIYDTVAYTQFGPVMYDAAFSNEKSKNKNLAVRWTAHDPANEGLTFYKLNRAENYIDYVAAIKTFDCPGQNFVFASKSGDIALWQQGRFPARWDKQGLYIMPGEDSSYAWQGFIPQSENPHSLNPASGFLESANQRPVDGSYPYFIPGSYITPRGITIEQKLAAMTNITPTDMMKLQYNYFNSLAQDLLPILVSNTNEEALSADAKKYFEKIKTWNLEANPESEGQSIYEAWSDSLLHGIWQDEISKQTPMAPMPEKQTTMELLHKHRSLRFIDDVNTTSIETLDEVVTTALNKATILLKKKEAEGKLTWAKFKNPTVYHLLKEALLPFARVGLNVGGNDDIVNAVTHSHGPSWRMIVHMTANTEAYGVYPAGQQGNPGSKYFDSFVDTWVKGEYYRLWFMKDQDVKDKKIKWTMKFAKA